MREMEQLPPDQRAVLSLVLTQQRSYAEVASALGISEQTVRERAHAALDALAAQESPPTPGPPARKAPPKPSSRTGGAILLGAIALAVVVVAIVLSSGGGKSSAQSASKPATPSTSSSSSTSAGGSGEAGGVHLDKQLSLSPTEPSSRASGEGIVVSKGGRRAFYVKTSGLSPTSGFYAVWLYKSASDAVALGKLPPVDSKGRAEGGGPITPQLSSFDKLVITREMSQHPSTPGPIVLSAPLR
ncbi:MAG: RNA polymerase sigma factor [Solirubrobacteraceae bacterium]